MKDYPHPLISAMPIIVLIGLLITVISLFGSVSITLVILLAVGMVSGSWTTIATIGVALLGISHALGISEAWAAGAIISEP